MKYFFITILSLLLLKRSYGLVGYKFEDNLSRYRVIPENGEMSVQLRQNLERISTCISFFVNFNRYSNLVPIFDFRNGYSEEPFEFVYGNL